MGMYRNKTGIFFLVMFHDLSGCVVVAVVDDEESDDKLLLCTWCEGEAITLTDGEMEVAGGWRVVERDSMGGDDGADELFEGGFELARKYSLTAKILLRRSPSFSSVISSEIDAAMAASLDSGKRI